MNKSTLPPHSAGVWVNCPGSIALIEQIDRIPLDDAQNESRKEGRAFHELSEMMLNSNTSDLSMMIGLMSGHGVPTPTKCTKAHNYTPMTCSTLAPN
jgi:hypothetical protein